MRSQLSTIALQTYDCLIIGGGINGAAVANIATQAGAKVCLLEKDDFAKGTSSRSTKLLHGGIRYLEHFEFDLVSESLRERYIQWQSVPHLVKPLPFVIPVYRGDKRPLWQLSLGVWLYDFLSGKYRIGQHRRLSTEEVIGLVPSINQQGLVGGVEYFDAQMNDSRIVIENILMAHLNGAVTLNYVSVVDFIKENGQIVGVTAKDNLTGEIASIKAKTVIAATGPWSDKIRNIDIPHQLPRLRPTKGVHLVYEGQIAPNAFLIQSKEDNRIFFVIPFYGNTLIGTTDTDFKGDPDNVNCDDADISYLLNEASRVFPQIHFDQNKILHTFAGIRPLVFEKGHESTVSRRHAIEKSASGVWYVMGGKYTTYRAMAEEVVIKALPQLKGQMPYSGKYVLYGSGAVNQELKLLRHRYGVSIDTIRHLISIYGSRFEDVLKLTLNNQSLKEPICTCSETIAAQVIYSRDIEGAVSLEDIVERRLNLQYYQCSSKQCRQRIKTLIGDKV